MNRKILIALAVLLPLLGLGLVYSWASGARQAAFDGAELVPSLRVTKEIPRGTPVDEFEEYVSVETYPKSMLPKDYFPSVEELQKDADDDVAERVISTGEFVTPEAIFSGTIPGAPENYEETTFSVAAAKGATGLEVGDRVAVYASFTDTGNAVRRVLPNVLVSRINGKDKGGLSEEEATAESVVITVAVTQDEASKLIYISSFGEISLSIVNANSSTDASSAPFNQPSDTDVTRSDFDLEEEASS